MKFLLEHCGFITNAATDQRLTGKELATAVQAGTARLRDRGVGPGHTILIYHGGSPNFFTDLFSVWGCGAAAACINPATTRAELQRLVEFVEPVAVIVDEKGEGSVGNCPVVTLGNMPKVTPSASGNPSMLDDPALILFTSGTTGEPKGVEISFRALMARLALNRTQIGDDDLANTLCVLPTHFGHGLIGNCLTPLMSGANLVLSPGSDLASVSRVGGIIDAFDITFMSSVPAFWKLALKAAKPAQGRTLARVHIGSAPLSSDLWSEVTAWSGAKQVVNMYGITEASNWIAGSSSITFEPEDGLIGTLWGGTAAIKGDDGKINAFGEGEILVQTPGLMTGYLQRPELTREVLQDGWLHTGDIGTISENGTIHLTGRKKYEINRAGIKVHPEDIDILLERHPDVLEACAFAVPDPYIGEVVGVAIVPDEDVTPDTQALRDWMAQSLVAEKLPSKWYIVDEIPKNDRGKINRDDVARACGVGEK